MRSGLAACVDENGVGTGRDGSDTRWGRSLSGTLPDEPLEPLEPLSRGDDDDDDDSEHASLQALPASLPSVPVRSWLGRIAVREAGLRMRFRGRGPGSRGSGTAGALLRPVRPCRSAVCAGIGECGQYLVQPARRVSTEGDEEALCRRPSACTGRR